MISEEDRKKAVEIVFREGQHFDCGGCPQCGGKNRVSMGNSFDGHILSYAEVCNDCGTACVMDEKIKLFQPNLHIITPCSRPENLILVAKSIPHDIQITWHIVQDTVRSERVQNLPELQTLVPDTRLYEYESEIFSLGEMKNVVLKNLLPREEDWVYVLDDDNLMHHNFIPVFLQAFYKTSCSGFLVGCDFQEGIVFKAAPDNLGMGKIDMAQACFSTTILEDNLFPEWGKEEDNVWINKVVFSRPHKIVFFSNIVASYHDGLRRGKNVGNYTDINTVSHSVDSYYQRSASISVDTQNQPE